jgi:hypothetical protein
VRRLEAEGRSVGIWGWDSGVGKRLVIVVGWWRSIVIIEMKHARTYYLIPDGKMESAHKCVWHHWCSIFPYSPASSWSFTFAW